MFINLSCCQSPFLWIYLDHLILNRESSSVFHPQKDGEVKRQTSKKALEDLKERQKSAWPVASVSYSSLSFISWFLYDQVFFIQQQHEFVKQRDVSNVGDVSLTDVSCWMWQRVFPPLILITDHKWKCNMRTLRKCESYC